MMFFVPFISIAVDCFFTTGEGVLGDGDVFFVFVLFFKSRFRSGVFVVVGVSAG